VTNSGTLAVTGATTLSGGAEITTSITTPSTTFAIANATATTVNAFGAATTLNIGAASATWNLGSNSTINGGSAANDDITIQGTSNATRTTSYVNLQPNGGFVGIGTATPTYNLDISGSIRAVQNNTNGFTMVNLNNTSYAIGDFFGTHYGINIVASNNSNSYYLLNVVSAATVNTTSFSGGTVRLRVLNDGTVCIGAATGSATLSVTGSASVSTTLAVTGATTLTGNLTSNGALISTPQALSGAGAVNVTTLTTAVTTTAPAQALTLADGTNGQIKTIVHQALSGGGTWVLTPTTKTGYTTITSIAVGETCTLQFFTTIGWCILSLRGAIAA
jgi:hypothetical protein